MSINDLYNKAGNGNGLRPSENPTKYTKTVFQDQSKSSGNPNATKVNTNLGPKATNTNKFPKV